MQYDKKTLTIQGAEAFAKANSLKQALVIDKIVISEATVAADADISSFTLANFTNSKQYDVNNITQDTNTFTVRGIIDNKGLTAEYKVSLIGLTAHVGTDTANESLIAIVAGENPFVLPAESETIIQFVPKISIAYSNSDKVTINVNDSVYVTVEDLDNYVNQLGYANKNRDNHFTKQNQFDVDPVNKDGNAYGLAKDAVTVTGDQEVAGKKTFDTAPINKANGKPYITADEVPAVSATLADTTKLANFTAGLQKNGKDVATVDQIPNLSAGNIDWTEINNDSSDNSDIRYHIVYGVHNNLLTLSGDVDISNKLSGNPTAFATLPDTIVSRINPKMFTSASSEIGCIFISMTGSKPNVFVSSSMMFDSKGSLTMRENTAAADYDLYAMIPLEPAK